MRPALEEEPDDILTVVRLSVKSRAAVYSVYERVDLTSSLVSSVVMTVFNSADFVFLYCRWS